MRTKCSRLICNFASQQNQTDMEIKEIYIKNFRNISEEGATINLSPITIFTGCNSAGKSTAAKALLLLESYLSDVRSNNFNLINTPMDFSKIGKLGSFDTVLNKSNKATKNNKITFGYSFASAIIVADIHVRLTFEKKVTDNLNNGWLKELTIIIDSKELLSIHIKDEAYFIDIKDNPKFIEYIRYYKIRHMISFWKEYEEQIRESKSYPQLGLKTESQFENLRPKIYELLALERTLVKDGIIRSDIFYDEVDSDFKATINLSDLVATIENIVDLNLIDMIMLDTEKAKGRRLCKEDISTICDTIKVSYMNKHNKYGKQSFSNREEYYLKYLHSYIDSEFLNFSDFKKQGSIVSDYTTEFNEKGFQEAAKVISMKYESAGILDIIESLSLNSNSFKLSLKYILKRILNPSLCKKIGYVDASTVDVKRLYLLNSSDSFGNLWKHFNDLQTSKISNIKDDRETFMKKWLQKFGICEDINIENIEGSLQIKLFSKENPEGRSLADYGYGVTQLVALLLNIEIAIHNTENKHISIVGEPYECEPVTSTIPYWLILEEPEVHLHPCLQSRLADLFLDASRYGVRLIIESHSEYLIRRTQVIVSEMLLNEDNIDFKNPFKVYYFPNGDSPFDMKYQPNGHFEETFGEGFFDEAGKWTRELIRNKRR